MFNQIYAVNKAPVCCVYQSRSGCPSDGPVLQTLARVYFTSVTAPLTVLITETHVNERVGGLITTGDIILCEYISDMLQQNATIW